MNPWEKGRRISIPSRSASNLVAVAAGVAGDRPRAGVGFVCSRQRRLDFDPLQPPGAEMRTEVSIPCSRRESRRAWRERCRCRSCLRRRGRGQVAGETGSTPDRTRLTHSNPKPKPNHPNRIPAQLPPNRKGPKQETELYTLDCTHWIGPKPLSD